MVIIEVSAENIFIIIHTSFHPSNLLYPSKLFFGTCCYLKKGYTKSKLNFHRNGKLAVAKFFSEGHFSLWYFSMTNDFGSPTLKPSQTQNLCLFSQTICFPKNLKCTFLKKKKIAIFKNDSLKTKSLSSSHPPPSPEKCSTGY